MNLFGRRKTPVTRSGLAKYDHLPAVQAVVEAWTAPGSNPAWHRMMKEDLRAQMPILTRALDRLEQEHRP